ncbi:TOMM precursor leader peptide-binding protein [Streptomyces panaciradicis]|uniref:TOMM precursor leader peptide-binding protein n=1 Tax=Streptomyces panaciradicis TaxID=1470261 RepID=UPI00201D05EB|nr:TOMM precursor leader peptide-binding protein [Streptomyces panaciradicis]MCL6669276.1 TOMM precursor leader peptide-binding protein [Streptomyces panaciradicis]
MADRPQVLVEPRQVVVGPWAPGCPECLRTRRAAATSAERAAELAAEVPDGELPTFLADAVAGLASAGSEERRYWIVDRATLALSRHAFLTDPHCPRCSALPPDTEQGAKPPRRARPKLSPESSRVRPLDRDALAALYVDGESGLIPSVTSYTQHSFPFTEAVLAVPGVSKEASGYGRTRDFGSAWSIAVAESLERLAAYAPGKRTAVTAAYADVADVAVDPRSLGLYPADRFSTPGFPYREFTEDAVTHWVWGYSFGQDRPVLVPESFVYYRLRTSSGGGHGFACEISSGCALGGCYEEAVLHGVLEVAERDAFLMAWYGRTPLPEIDLATVPDRRIPLVAERIERQGYRVHVFDTTQDHGIPSFWTFAEDVTGTGRPRAVSTGGSGLRPAEAILAALHELSQTVEYVTVLALDPGWRERAQHLADHPDDVVSMADHLLCAAGPAAFDRYSFLLDAPRTLGWQQALERWRWPRNTDIGADLDEAVRRFAAAGMDVVAVDTTSTEQTAGGFRCVKVIAPGSVPMTFGHAARRVTGLPRLPEVRNPHPHPFP